MQTEAGYWQSFVDHAEMTDVGLRRANNQDSMAAMLAGTEVDFFRRGHLFMVADGMGRHAAGELASKISVDTVPLEYFKQPEGTPPAALKFALVEGNRRIYARGQQNPDFKGMGTTTSVLVLLPQGALCGHVGDSRIYRLRGNRLEQLTFDHSVVWEMRAAAKASGSEVPGFIPKNYITRSLGHDPEVHIDFEGPFPLAAGDTFLLCSDGLSGQVEDEELGAILSVLPPQDAAQTLIDLANLRGGPDNITVIVVKVVDLSRVKSASPPKLSSENRAGNEIHPFVWAGMGATALMGAILAVLGQTWPGLASAGVAALLGLFALAKATTGGTLRTWRSGQLGRGPHTSTVCQVNDAFVEKLASLLSRMRDTAVQQRFQVEWGRYDRLCQAAYHAKNVHEYPEAVRQYCYAINYLMNELRKQRPVVSHTAVLEEN